VTTIAGLLADVRALPRPIWLLSAGVFVNRLGSFVWYFLALFVVERGYGPAEAGLALAAFGAGTIPASVVGGWLADRLGRRETIVLSMLSGAVTFLALAVAQELALIIALVALAGFTSELYRPASSALIADLTPRGRRVTAYALYRLAFNAGIAGGGALAGVAASASLLAVFVLESVTCAAFGAVALVALRGVGAPNPATIRATTPLARAVQADRAFLGFLLASSLIIVVQLQQSSTLPLHIDAQGLSPSVLGALISVNGVLIVLVELPLSAATQRLARPLAMAAGALLIGVGMAATGLATTAGALLAAVVVCTLGEMVFFPLASAHVADTAPPGRQGRYQGLFGLTWSGGITLAPVLGTALYALSTPALWLTCAALGVVAAVLLLLSCPRSPRACCAAG
jgi:MFS family permease